MQRYCFFLNCARKNETFWAKGGVFMSFGDELCSLRAYKVSVGRRGRGEREGLKVKG
jgi:hypothetical protein